MNNLIHALRMAEIAKPVLTEIDQLDTRIAHEFARRQGHHNLTAMSDRHQPRGAFSAVP